MAHARIVLINDEQLEDQWQTVVRTSGLERARLLSEAMRRLVSSARDRHV